MRHLFVLLCVATVALAMVLVVVSSRPALAVGSQIRTFVASTGSDANPCTRTSPCRTFAAALTQTTSGGEVVALDTGGYGTLTITQSVTITAAPGVLAFIAPSTGAAITVNVGASDTVILRNLQLNGQGGSYGVNYEAGGTLHLENLSVTGFTSHGINVVLSSAAELHVVDTVVRGSGGYGIYLTSSLAIAHAVILRTRLESNGNGLIAVSNILATVKETNAIGNAAQGFVVQPSSGPSELDLEGCMASSNGTFAILANSVSIPTTATIRVSNCIVTGNGTGLQTTPYGAILSRSNNTVEANDSNGSFTGTYAAK